MMRLAATGGINMAIKNIAVMGAGLMGNAISIVFAKNADLNVVVYEVVRKMITMHR